MFADASHNARFIANDSTAKHIIRETLGEEMMKRIGIIAENEEKSVAAESEKHSSKNRGKKKESPVQQSSVSPERRNLPETKIAKMGPNKIAEEQNGNKAEIKLKKKPLSHAEKLLAERKLAKTKSRDNQPAR